MGSYICGMLLPHRNISGRRVYKTRLPLSIHVGFHFALPDLQDNYKITRTMPTTHLAILTQPWLDLILDGHKT